MMRRRRGPGLVGTVARTAVIAGTATAVSGAVSNHQQQKAMAQQGGAPAPDPAVDAVAAAPETAAPAASPVAAPTGAAGDELVAQLQQLADLKAAGILSDEEFASAKAKLLA